MNKEDKIVKEIFETLIKYTNLTPDAIDDLYYLQGYIEEKDKEIARLNNIIEKLEKWLEQEYAIVKSNGIEEPNNPEWYIKWNERKNVLDKLKELKEGKDER